MGRSISPMCETTVTGGSPRAAPRLIVPMSLRLAIPRRVALQQSSPPLHQPTVILKQKERLEKENPLNGKCASFRLSQLRGSPQKSVLPKPTSHRSAIGGIKLTTENRDPTRICDKRRLVPYAGFRLPALVRTQHVETCDGVTQGGA